MSDVRYGPGPRRSDPAFDVPGRQSDAPDFGEPWGWGDEYGVDWKEGFTDMKHPERWKRAVACINAMRGIPDPEAFVKAAIRVRGALASARHATQLLQERFMPDDWAGSIASYCEAEAEFDAAQAAQAARGTPRPSSGGEVKP